MPQRFARGTGVLPWIAGSDGIAKDKRLLGEGHLDFDAAHIAAEGVIRNADAGDHEAIDVARIMGQHAAIAVRELTRYLPIRNVALGGGLMSGGFGRILVVAIKDELRRRFRSLSQRISIRGCDENCIFAGALGAAMYARSVDIRSLQIPTSLDRS
jgi:predicted NBD/HSP70 family sugar kinase